MSAPFYKYDFFGFETGLVVAFLIGLLFVREEVHYLKYGELLAFYLPTRTPAWLCQIRQAYPVQSVTTTRLSPSS